MMTKWIAVGIGAAVAVAAVWAGRAAWRANHDLVTLHVRNAPLSDVVRELERQTKKKVLLDQKLDAKVTMDVNSIPLTNVLDLVADQAGARWGKTYAVYDNEAALRRFESVLHGEAKLDEAGWTNLAPRFAGADFPGAEAFAGGKGPVRILMGSPDGGGAGGQPMLRSDEDVQKFVQDNAKDGAIVTRNEDGKVKTITRTINGGDGAHIIKVTPGGTVVEQGRADGESGRPMRNLTVRRIAGPGGTTTTTSDGDGRMKIIRMSPGGEILQEDEWSATRLVLETALTPQLGDAIPEKATAETAAQSAGKVHGRFATYYALEKPPIAGMPGMGKMIHSISRQIHVDDGTNNPIANGDIRSRIEAEARQRRMEELSLTPEQQVQRARQKQEAQSGK